VAQKLGEAWGQPTVVENRPRRRDADRHRVGRECAPDGIRCWSWRSPFAVNPSLYAKLPYDTVKDFAPLLLAGQTPNLLVVNPEVPKSIR